MTYFPPTEKWFLPEGALQASSNEIASHGEQGHEGTCLWLGKKDGGEAQVTHVALFRGDGVTNEPANVEISADLMAELHDRAIELGIVLIAQIHSHGPLHGIDLSPVDHKCGIRAPYFLSVVSPNYGRRKLSTIFDCGVHVFLPDFGYRRLTDHEVAARIIMTMEEISILTVGEA